MRKEGKTVNAIAHVYLLLGVLLVLFPLYLLFAVSFKPLAASAANFLSFPRSLYLDNFKGVFKTGLYLNSIKNSVVVVTVPLVFVTTLVPMVSFAIARNSKKKRYYRILYLYIIASLFVPFNAIMIPIVILSSKLDMMNLWGLIVLYVSLSFSQGTFLFVGYIRSLPLELDESAYMDGCSVPRLFFSIIMPLCKPMIITIVILNSLWYWNDFMLPIVILNKSKYYQTLAQIGRAHV
jgi:raffinose/stachyose/melibiose transport system permease protein